MNDSFRSLRQRQEECLRHTIQRLFKTSSQYRSKMEIASLTPEDFKSLDDLVRFPFTMKEDLEANYPLLETAVPREDLVRIHASSGTRGKPTLTAYSASDLQMWKEQMARCLSAYGVRREDTVVITHGYGLFTGGLGVHYGCEHLGTLVVPTSAGNSERQLDLIEDLKATVLVGSPSYILKLANLWQERGAKPLSLRICICGSEPWSEGVREEIERRFSVRAYDLYGLSEVLGPGIASETTEHRGELTIWEDHFFPEIIDNELVISTLTKEAMPLLRYRTGDKTSWGKGQSLFRTIERISGRKDDMIKIKGVKVYPSQIENLLVRKNELNGNFLLEVRRVNDLDNLKILVESRTDHFDLVNLSASLERSVKSALGISAFVEIVAPGTLAENPGKAQRVRRI